MHGLSYSDAGKLSKQHLIKGRPLLWLVTAAGDGGTGEEDGGVVAERDKEEGEGGWGCWHVCH